MHLTRWTLVLAAVSIVACDDPSAPPVLATNYTLASIDGRPLPTFLSPIPEEPIVLSGSLKLDGSGNATLIERRQPIRGGQLILTSTYTYVISGEEIQFEMNPPCPPNASCIAPPKGTITASRVSLQIGGSLSGVVYEFRQFPPD